MNDIEFLKKYLIIIFFVCIILFGIFLFASISKFNFKREKKQVLTKKVTFIENI